MAEGALFDVAKGIIGIAGKLAAKEIALIGGVKDEITKLGETVSIIKAVLLDAEAKQHNSEAIKLWLKSLKDAMCDADDLLDEISTEALRREVMTRDKKAKEENCLRKKSNQVFGPNYSGKKCRGYKSHQMKKQRNLLIRIGT
ncbi:hypothetical protein CMV_006100 [Castanea mollissima]|uniref:Disease resistance N-terminal domain-containing protein n=1 Tax=Castanea mollissima TaxID=60419 RepID=A0A8J4RWZ8_9ROSI|nr:hypothetical protein CMV_006100 [Castanea mollissima]